MPCTAPSPLQLPQGPCFEFQEKATGAAPYLAGLFAFNYSALASLGLSASALSGQSVAVSGASSWGVETVPQPQCELPPTAQPCHPPPLLPAGSKYALPKLVAGITKALFLEDSPAILAVRAPPLLLLCACMQRRCGRGDGVC